jgi:hypothetical protein
MNINNKSTICDCLCCGTTLRGMKWIVLEPTTLSPTPWERRQHSFAAARNHVVDVASSWIHCRYSILAPEIGWTKALAMVIYTGCSTCDVAVTVLMLLTMIGLKFLVIGYRAWLTTWCLARDLVW